MDIVKVKINGVWTEVPAVVGPQGTTFTPSVSNEGVLSWSNDGNKQNPASVNIKGPQGETGPQGPKGDNTPIKGVDYWTSEDQQSIIQATVEAVLEEYPAAESNEF